SKVLPVKAKPASEKDIQKAREKSLLIVPSVKDKADGKPEDKPGEKPNDKPDDKASGEKAKAEGSSGGKANAGGEQHGGN
ncbi:MAG: hypothetical protein II110_10725, partial [Treponema sp.]|nr:hypothetical protein [Treponema sp.]